ncbi:MAG: hypothetical protein WCO26_24395, partial [Deltaproteobacteria bacterium]
PSLIKHFDQQSAEVGLGHLAYREAKAVKEMSSKEPYKSAVIKLAEDPMWRKYSQLVSPP